MNVKDLHDIVHNMAFDMGFVDQISRHTPCKELRYDGFYTSPKYAPYKLSIITCKSIPCIPSLTTIRLFTDTAGIYDLKRMFI